MVNSIMGSLKMIKEMVKENKSGLINQNILVRGLMIKEVVMEFKLGLMEENIKEIGKMIRCTVKAL